MKGMFPRLSAAALTLCLLLSACSSPGTAPVSSAPVASHSASSAPAVSSVSEAPVSSAPPSSSEESVSSEEASSQPPVSSGTYVPAPDPTPAPPPPESPELSSAPSSSESPSAVSSEISSAVSSGVSSAESSVPPSSSVPSSSESSVSSSPSSTETSSSPEESRGEELSPIEQVVAGAADKRHLQLSEIPLDSEEKANRFFYEMVTKNYVDFGVFVVKPVFAHTAEEYAELFPGLDSIKITEAAVYSNGYYFRYRLSRNANFALKTALVSGNTAYLTETELQAYNSLWVVLNTCTSPSMSAAANVMAIHNYIVANTTYSTASANAYDAVGVLVDHAAVCDGYSKAFQLFMDALGIPSVRFTGTAGGVSHAWNAVQLNGCWYHVDTTWDDPTPDAPGRVSYEYFLVTDSILQQDHSWDYAPVVCSDESMLLYPYTQCFGETMDELTQRFNEQKTNGYTHATLVYPAGLASDEEIVRAMGANSYYPSFPRGPWSVLVVRTSNG